MTPDEAERLLDEAATAVYRREVPYALALEWERDGAAAWDACVDQFLLIDLGSLCAPGAYAVAMSSEHFRECCLPMCARCLATARALVPGGPSLAALLVAARNRPHHP